MCYLQAAFCPGTQLDGFAGLLSGFLVQELRADTACSNHSGSPFGKTNNEVSNQLLGVHQRGHLRRRAFCAALVFAFSLWRV
jgi:hypothetical protein